MSASYWYGWLKNKGNYFNDLMWAYKAGVSIIDKYEKVKTPKPKCVVFDIDDTLVFGDPEEALGLKEFKFMNQELALGVKEMPIPEERGEDIFFLPKNEPIVKLLEYAKKKGFVIVILTARPKSATTSSIENLNHYRIPYNSILMNEGDRDPCFKLNTRRKLAERYHICLTVGDQITDVLCPGANTAFIKLPEPDSKCCYAYMPNGI